MGANRVDGDDVLAVLRAVRDAAARARSGGGATLIEAVVERADAPERLRGFLAAEKILSPEAERALRAEVEGEVRAAFTAEEGGRTAPLGEPHRRRLRPPAPLARGPAGGRRDLPRRDDEGLSGETDLASLAVAV